MYGEATASSWDVRAKVVVVMTTSSTKIEQVHQGWL